MNEDNRQEHLIRKTQEASLVRQMCETPGFTIIRNKFEDKVKKATSLIVDMSTPDDVVKSLRQKVHVWTEITNLLKTLMVTGDCAARIIREENNLDQNTTPVLDGQGE